MDLIRTSVGVLAADVVAAVAFDVVVVATGVVVMAIRYCCGLWCCYSGP